MTANSFRRIFTENLDERSKDSKVSILFMSEWYYKIYKITYREIENVNRSIPSFSLGTNQFFKIDHKEGMADPKILKLIKLVNENERLLLQPTSLSAVITIFYVRSCRRIELLWDLHASYVKRVKRITFTCTKIKAPRYADPESNESIPLIIQILTRWDSGSSTIPLAEDI